MIRLLRMYFPRNWEFGSALSKPRNFGGGTPLKTLKTDISLPTHQIILRPYHCSNSERVGSHKVKFWTPNLHVLHFTLFEILYNSPMMVNCDWNLCLRHYLKICYCMRVPQLVNTLLTLSWNPKCEHMSIWTYWQRPNTAALYRARWIQSTATPNFFNIYINPTLPFTPIPPTKQKKLPYVFHSVTQTTFLHCYDTHMEICNVRVLRRW
jgi:hypothetical protein